MRRSSVIAAIVLVAMLVVGPVFAITGNWVKDFEHPFVAMVVFYDAEGDFIWRCSGSLIDETTLLTAGHCTDAADDGAVTARVYFQQDAGVNYDPELGYDPVTGYPDDCAGDTFGKLCMTSDELHNYGFLAGFPNTKDAGLVILDEPIYLDEYGELPVAGTLDDLQTHRDKKDKDTIFTVSGYGLSYRSKPQSPVPTLSYRERLMAASELVTVVSANTDGFNLQTRGNGDDLGGTCSGDSGGPVFLGGFDSNLIVAVTSFGTNELCRGTDFSYRVDQQEVLDWIDDIVNP